MENECERYFQYSITDLVIWINRNQDDLIRFSAMRVQLEPNSCSQQDCDEYMNNIRKDIEALSEELERKLRKG